MPQSRKTKVSLIDTPITIMFLAVFGILFCAVRKIYGAKLRTPPRLGRRTYVVFIVSVYPE
jgi:hypothetical protein